MAFAHSLASRTALDVVALAEPLREMAIARDEAGFAVSCIRDRAVLLGESQRAGRVIDLAGCRRDGLSVVRRTTSGTAMFVDRAIVLTIALPRVNAVVADATLRTLVNRNIRPVLKALTRIGAPAQYFGREWIAARHRPLATIGTHFDRRGAVLLEIAIAWEGSVALPSAICAHEESAIDHWRGKTPVALVDVLERPTDIESFAQRFHDALAGTFGGASLVEDLAIATARAPIETPDDPVPFASGAIRSTTEPCAIGLVDVARETSSQALWCGGDAWAPRWVLDAVGEAITAERVSELALEDGALEGARIDDFVRAAHRLSHG